MKKSILLLLASALLLSSCTKKLNIEVVDNRKHVSTEPIYYWVNNSTGETLKNVEFSINDTYFHAIDIPTDGNNLDLYDFAAKDGKRFDYLETKPLTLKAKSKQGVYSISFEDIPTNFEAPEGYTRTSNVLDWIELPPLETVCADGGSVKISIICAVTDKQKAEAETEDIQAALLKILALKAEDDFNVLKEKALEKELKAALQSFNVKDVKFMDVVYVPAE